MHPCIVPASSNFSLSGLRAQNPTTPFQLSLDSKLNLKPVPGQRFQYPLEPPRFFAEPRISGTLFREPFYEGFPKLRAFSWEFLYCIG